MENRAEIGFLGSKILKDPSWLSKLERGVVKGFHSIHSFVVCFLDAQAAEDLQNSLTNSATIGWILKQLWEIVHQYCSIMFNYIQLWSTMFNYFQLSTTKFNFVQFCSILFNFVQFCSTFYLLFLKICSTLFNFPQLCSTMFSFLNVAQLFFDCVQHNSIFLNFVHLGSTFLNFTQSQDLPNVAQLCLALQNFVQLW